MAFTPIPQKKLSALQLEWEIKLRQAGEGPPEIRSLYACDTDTDAVGFCSYERKEVQETKFCLQGDNGGPGFGQNIDERSLDSDDNYQYWCALADKVRNLPLYYDIFERAFLVEYAYCGVIKLAAKLVGISERTGQRYLAAFNRMQKQ